MHVGTSNRHLERKQYSLNTSITLKVNDHEYDHLVNRGPEIGFFFYAIDKADIFKFVHARVTAKGKAKQPALHAIHDYYEANGIEEDDHAIDTAERQWKRWMAVKQKEQGAESPQRVPLPPPVLLSERQAEEMASRVGRFMDEKVVSSDARYRPSLEAWVMCDLTTLTHREVANRFKKDHRRVSRSVKRFREYLSYNDDLRTIVGYCLKTTQAQPTPSAAS